jgi:NADPH-dependent glutamate synthase beta subunit-like oxidoreductase
LSHLKPSFNSKLKQKNVKKKNSQKVEQDEKTCVIGSGFSGLAVCGSLKRHGIPFDCFEKNDKV